MDHQFLKRRDRREGKNGGRECAEAQKIRLKPSTKRKIVWFGKGKSTKKGKENEGQRR